MIMLCASIDFPRRLITLFAVNVAGNDDEIFIACAALAKGE
jgi:hypothetical protein